MAASAACAPRCGAAALEFIDRAGAEVLLIETSGLVEPQALLDQYDLCRRRWRVASICAASRVVDPLQVQEAIAKRAEALHQIELADCLLLTKLDCASPAQVRARMRCSIGWGQPRAGWA